MRPRATKMTPRNRAVNLLYELNLIAKNHNNAQYGLPLGDDDSYAQMLEAVLCAFNHQKEGEK